MQFIECSISGFYASISSGYLYIVLVCSQGWTTDGSGTNPACTKDVDECKENKHTCSSNPPVECRNTRGSFTCENCPIGKSYIKESCEHFILCVFNIVIITYLYQFYISRCIFINFRYDSWPLNQKNKIIGYSKLLVLKMYLNK